jgi:hypothetical protein
MGSGWRVGRVLSLSSFSFFFLPVAALGTDDRER